MCECKKSHTKNEDTFLTVLASMMLAISVCRLIYEVACYSKRDHQK